MTETTQEGRLARAQRDDAERRAHSAGQAAATYARECARLRARLERAEGLLRDCQDIYEDRDPPMNQTEAEKALWGMVNAHLRGEDHERHT